MSATHGRLGAVYALHENNFVGDGLNDATWGTGFAGAASSYFEVEIDGAGTPDTFKWRQDGGAWTEAVNITGAAQTLADSQTISFAATTGHTVGDKWWIGNLKAEACDESGVQGQITESTRRILNPNAPPTWADTGSKHHIRTDFVRGIGYFDDNVTVVTVEGNNGYIPSGALEKVGYLYGWDWEPTLDLAPLTAFQAKWKSWLAGLAEAAGAAKGYFANKKWFDDWKEAVSGNQFYFLQLFTYDPDDDQTGDHFNCWVTFDKLDLAAGLDKVVSQDIGFKVEGPPSFTANA